MVAGGNTKSLPGSMSSLIKSNQDEKNLIGELKLFELSLDRCVGIINIQNIITSADISKNEKCLIIAAGKFIYYLDIDPNSNDKEFLY